MVLPELHRLSEGVIAACAVIHIANRVVGLHSVESHIAFMKGS